MIINVKNPSRLKKKFGSNQLTLINSCNFPIHVIIMDDPNEKLKISTQVNFLRFKISHQYTDRIPSTQQFIITPNRQSIVNIETRKSFLTILRPPEIMPELKPSNMTLDQFCQLNLDFENNDNLLVEKYPIQKQQIVTLHYSEKLQ